MKRGHNSESIKMDTWLELRAACLLFGRRVARSNTQLNSTPNLDFNCDTVHCFARTGKQAVCAPVYKSLPKSSLSGAIGQFLYELEGSAYGVWKINTVKRKRYLVIGALEWLVCPTSRKASKSELSNKKSTWILSRSSASTLRWRRADRLSALPTNNIFFTAFIFQGPLGGIFST